ncbi:unnamed protein product [Lota lota]
MDQGDDMLDLRDLQCSPGPPKDAPPPLPPPPAALPPLPQARPADQSQTEEEEVPFQDDEDEEERIREEPPNPSLPPPPPVKRRTIPHLVDQQALVDEMLTLALHLAGSGYSKVINLLVLLANQTPSLCQLAVARLEALGVQEAEEWLQPELQTWGGELQGQTHTWKILQDHAARWLSLWTTKYKVCTQPSEHMRVDQRDHVLSVHVLNFFCSSRRDQQGAPGARHDTVMLSPPACFPLPRLNLLPLSCPIGQLDTTPTPRRFFLLEQSHPEYYR